MARGKAIARRPPAASGSGQGTQSHRRTEVSIGAAPWSVVLEIPRDRYLAPVKSAGLVLGLGILAAALIGVGGGLWGTRRLGRAVAGLARPDQAPDEGPAITEISAVRRLIDEARQRIASFAATQDRAIEQERRRVAREVHDQLGQVFTAIKLIVQSVPHKAFPPDQEAALHQALEMGITSARRITAELRPPLLDDLGLAAALDHFAREIARTGELTCAVDILDQDRLCGPQALALFRIVQEATNNVLKHAGATRIAIERPRRRRALPPAHRGRRLRLRRGPGSPGCDGADQHARTRAPDERTLRACAGRGGRHRGTGVAAARQDQFRSRR
jgi:signal transduction histidine kinase